MDCNINRRECFSRLPGWWISALAMLRAGGATVTPATFGASYPKMYSAPPTTILILPPINNTTAAAAKEYFSCSLSEALGQRGYYPLPVEALHGILREEGYYDTETITPVILTNLKKHFGAEAVLFSTIDRWDKSWFLFSGYLEIDSRFALVGTARADTLWDYRMSARVNLGSQSEQLLVAALESALKTATEDYFPHARQANISAFREALPCGPYHPDFGTDSLQSLTPDKHGYLEIDK